MEKALTISWIQAPLSWEQPSKNRTFFQKQFADIKADVVLLPEMFSTGFSMQPDQLAETMDGETVSWMKDQAVKWNMAICGSVIIKADGQFYNRLIWANPDASVWIYDKRHLFSYAGEDKVYAAGNERVIWNYKGWKILPQICFDLRFPVWSRNQGDYDLVFYVANWPAKRAFAWKQLLIARAIENQSFVIGVNRVGDDGNQIAHSGDSVALNPLGEVMKASTPNEFEVSTTVITKEELDNVRVRFKFLDERDTFNIL